MGLRMNIDGTYRFLGKEVNTIRMAGRVRDKP